ncbi:hypothetical protein ACX9QF_004908, partial [Citrobacter freundii]
MFKHDLSPLPGSAEIQPSFFQVPGKYHRFGRWYLVHFFSEQERCCTFSLSHIYLYPLYRVDIWAEVNEINSSTCH